ncbi:hypothetical protein CKC_03495 [Candidatus Liberibacter solanacearum CLso-ZC1]|uniref:Uncharacterized protein n=1 Tax=Liberibacter solanacearum (strain CLso-ZC1) TaxID=658172 RepID=E4UBE3_LIBSC|nr:hypothetical protein CKC_03495 [Candidatus Liberibacter solanacearum CLso-ZC1]
MFINYFYGLFLSFYFGLACWIVWDIIKVNNTITCLNKEKLKLFSKMRGIPCIERIIEKFHNTYSAIFNLKIYMCHNININI